jgi:hypothetical protein
MRNVTTGLNMYRVFVLLIAIFILTACGSGAVVFAPTPPPPDLSPLRYTHPSGVFSVAVPRNWSNYVQNTTQLAAAAFAPPGSDEPTVHFAVVNLGESMGSAALGEFITLYQTEIRPDASHYTEVNRQAMGDGSWRLAGLRESAGGVTQQVNTFIQQNNGFVSVIEALVPNDAEEQTELQTLINTFTVDTDATLQPAEASALAFATPAALNPLHISAWTTPTGVFFITGEVGNYGTQWVNNVPIRAVLRSADGLAVAEAVDTVMGYGIPLGGFAPFSLRFGGGQPALAAGYDLIIGDETWDAEAEEPILGQDSLTWVDDSSLTPDGRLIITGSVTNTGDANAYEVRAVVTVFDEQGDVIAAGFTDASPALAPNSSADFSMIMPEMGGSPANYIVNVQARP